MMTRRIAASVLLMGALVSGCGDDASKSKTTSANSSNSSNSANSTNSANSSNSANSTNSTNSANGVSGLPIDAIDEAFVAALCDAVFECDTVQPELSLVLGRFSSAAECKASLDPRTLDIDTAEIVASYQAGRIEYDQERAGECLVILKDVLCAGGGLEDTEECSDVVSGTLEAGEFCTTGDECVGGLTCDRSLVEDACYGECAPDCGAETCTSEQYCSFEDVCVDRGASGASCDWSGDCEVGLICSDEVCGAPFTKAEGEACAITKECQEGLFCNSSCVKVERGGEGASCSFGQDDVDVRICQPGLVCTNFMFSETGIDGVCAAPKTAGQPCHIFFECAWGLTCQGTMDSTPGTCVPTYADGEDCDEDFDCQSQECTEVCEPLGEQMLCELP